MHVSSKGLSGGEKCHGHSPALDDPMSSRSPPMELLPPISFSVKCSIDPELPLPVTQEKLMNGSQSSCLYYSPSVNLAWPEIFYSITHTKYGTLFN